MRIAQVAPYFYPHIGGVESHVLTLSSGLVEKGHKVTVFTSNYENLKEREVMDGIEIVRVEQRANLFSTPITPVLRKIIARADFDVVHAHTPPPLSAYYSAKGCKRSKTPFVITYHCDLELPGILGKIAVAIYQRTCNKYTFSQAQRVIVHTKTYGATSRSIWEFEATVIPSAVDPKRFENVDSRTIKKRYELEGKKVVLFVGRLVSHKGLDYLIDSVEFTAKDVIYLIVGKGEYLNKLRRKVRERKMGHRVILTGGVPYNELPKYFAACDVFVLPSFSRLEAFGLVVLEAMASSKPVIVSNIPGVTEVIVEGEQGLHVEPMSAQDLADKINVLLSDPYLRKKMGESGKKKVETEFTWDKVVSQIEEVYKGVV